MEKTPALYILSNKPNGALYIGVTSRLQARIYEHRNKLVSGFTSRYNVDRLVYFELFDDMYSAISREKQLKAGPRRKKIQLIESINPEWNDMYDRVYGD